MIMIKNSKKLTALVCVMATIFSLTGCGTMTNLTEEETAIISEYAVNMLLKYDKNNDSKLLDIEEEVVEEVVEEEITEENSEADAVAEDESENITTEENTETITASVEDVSQDVTEPAVQASIESYYGIDGFCFQFMGYEVVDSYPQANGENLFFSMDATEGSRLLVIKISATNLSGSDQMLDMGAYNVKMRVSVNGEKAHNTLSTMLLNDIKSFKGNISAGGVEELVSIIEIPQETEVNQITMVLRGNGENVSIDL